MSRSQVDMLQSSTCSWPLPSTASSVCGSVLLCRVSPQWRSSGKTSTGKWDCGAALCAQPPSLSPHLISHLSLFFSLLPPFFPSVCPSPFLTMPAGTEACAHAHTKAGVSAYPLRHAHSHSVSPVNTLAHRHKHKLRQSKSKQRAAGERKEIEGAEPLSQRDNGGEERIQKWRVSTEKGEGAEGDREGVDVDTMRKHKGFHIFPD